MNIFSACYSNQLFNQEKKLILFLQISCKAVKEFIYCIEKYKVVSLGIFFQMIWKRLRILNNHYYLFQISVMKLDKTLGKIIKRKEVIPLEVHLGCQCDCKIKEKVIKNFYVRILTKLKIF